MTRMGHTHCCAVYVLRELVRLICVAIILDTGDPSVLVEIRPDADPLWRGKVLLNASRGFNLRSNIVIQYAHLLRKNTSGRMPSVLQRASATLIPNVGSEFSL